MPIVRTVAARRLRTYFVVIRKFLRKILGLTRYHSSWVPRDFDEERRSRLRHNQNFGSAAQNSVVSGFAQIIGHISFDTYHLVIWTTRAGGWWGSVGLVQVKLACS